MCRAIYGYWEIYLKASVIGVFRHRNLFQLTFSQQQISMENIFETNPSETGIVDRCWYYAANGGKGKAECAMRFSSVNK